MVNQKSLKKKKSKNVSFVEQQKNKKIVDDYYEAGENVLKINPPELSD